LTGATACLAAMAMEGDGFVYVCPEQENGFFVLPTTDA